MNETEHRGQAGLSLDQRDKLDLQIAQVDVLLERLKKLEQKHKEFRGILEKTDDSAS